jgi:hypothetical protein
MTRYKISKEQLEMVVESFVMEAAVAKKAPVKNMIPSQGAEAKKHVKNKMSGNMVEKGEGVPTPSAMKKKNPHAPESKKHVSINKLKHSNKAKVVKENDEELEEGFLDVARQTLGMSSGKDKSAAEKSFDEVNPKAKTDQSANKEKWMARAKSYSYKGKFVINPKTRELNWEGTSAAPGTGGSSGFGTAQ